MILNVFFVFSVMLYRTVGKVRRYEDTRLVDIHNLTGMCFDGVKKIVYWCEK